MRRLAPIAVLAVLVTGGLALGAAAPATPDGVVAGVRETYRELSALSADFTQTTTVPGFSTTLVSKGRVYLAKGRMRWDYTEPSDQRIYVNEGRIQYFIPAHKQVIVSTLSPDADGQIPLHLLMTLDRLDEGFAVAWEDPAAPAREGAYRLRLTPKTPAAGLDHVTVGVDPQRRVVTAVALHPKNGNVSSFVFSRLVVNPRLKASLFAFTVPEGVEVVETPAFR